LKEAESESKKKEELMAEANQAIEDLTQEKHDVCAKFKHFLQVYVQDVQTVN
jgi:hypothetical protein